MQVYVTHSSFNAEKLQQHEAGFALSFKLVFYSLLHPFYQKKKKSP